MKFWISTHLWQRNTYQQTRTSSWPKNFIRQPDSIYIARSITETKSSYNKHRYYSVNLLCKIKKNKRNHKSFNNHHHSLFFLKVIFPRRLWLIPSILKWKDCKILTKFVPSQTSSKDLQNLIITSSSFVETLCSV